MKLTYLIAIATCGLSSFTAQGASLVLDSFTEGDHFLSHDDDLEAVAAVTTPFGTSRRTTLGIPRLAPGTTVASTLSTTDGTLGFVVDGVSSISRPLSLRMSYRYGGPFSLLGYSAFEFDISALSGSGSLIVELGSQSTYRPTANRIALTGPGTVSVPFSELNFGSNGSIESFSALHFTVEAETEEFSMTLDEIRVVPEPSTTVLSMPLALTLLLRRRRT